MARASYVRLYSDERGETHFEEVGTELWPVDFAPPAPPLNVATLYATSRCSFVGAPPDWRGDIPHPSPRRQIFCILQGECEVTVSDGTVRRFIPGNMLLLEDTSGAGHATRVVSEDDLLIFAVALDA